MQENWEEEVSLMYLSRTLKKLGWTRKKQTHYRECDPLERASFYKKLAEISEEKRVLVDEMGMDSDKIYPQAGQKRAVL
jgi:hypothetical protein